MAFFELNKIKTWVKVFLISISFLQIYRQKCLKILGRNLDVPAIVGGCLENSSSFLESFGGFLALSSSLLRRLLKKGGGLLLLWLGTTAHSSKACLDYAVLHTNWARPVVECQCTLVNSTQKLSAKKDLKFLLAWYLDNDVYFVYLWEKNLEMGWLSFKI